VVVKCAMAPYQSCVYSWIKATGTLRLDPLAPVVGRARRGFAPLNNKCMELRKARRPRCARSARPPPSAAWLAIARVKYPSWRAAGGATAGGRTCWAVRQGQGRGCTACTWEVRPQTQIQIVTSDYWLLMSLSSHPGQPHACRCATTRT